MFQPEFVYTTDMVNDLLKIERYRTSLEYLYLPTRIKQELLYKAKMKKTHFSTSIEGNLLSYDQVEKVIQKKVQAPKSMQKEKLLTIGMLYPFWKKNMRKTGKSL